MDFKDLEKEIQGLDSKNKGYEQLGLAQSGFSWIGSGFQGWDSNVFHG
jgi:hypothetical protein